LAQVLDEGVSIDDVIQPVADHRQLSTITAGDPTYDGDLLATSRAAVAFQRLRNRGEVVIVETSVIDEGSDGLVVAAMCDAAVLIVPVGARLAAVERGVRELDLAGARLSGTILVKRRRSSRRSRLR
jgi:Mrp family chromosome partitioning ATPase